jgi:hypothetical protein
MRLYSQGFARDMEDLEVALIETWLIAGGGQM